MNKSKVLSVAIAAALVSAMAATAAFSASAIVSTEDGIKDEPVGIVGSFPGPDGKTWDGVGFPMTDDDGDGVWEGTVKIDSVTEDMIDVLKSDGKDTGKKGIQFKVRTSGSWDNSWGEYEGHKVRTYNSQTNCCVTDAVVGKGLTINVKLDTKSIHPDCELTADDLKEDVYTVWPVTYTFEVVDAAGAPAETPAAETPAAETPAEEEPAETPAEETPAEETESPETGDTTSAAALVAAVLASLGAAVVMTKKASKE